MKHTRLESPSWLSALLPVLAGCAIGLTACAAPKGEAPEQPRLVILYATCTVNRDYLAPYNDAVAFTPNLQQFAAESVVFTTHHTESGQSGTAYASIFTGLQADQHGIHRHPTRLGDELYLIAEAYADHGYETFFWNRHPMASPGLNFGQGVAAENTFDDFLRADSPELARILRRLREDASYKAFVMTNFTVTHAPYGFEHLNAFAINYPAETNGISNEALNLYNAVYRQYDHELQWDFAEFVAREKLTQDDIRNLAASIELLYKSNVNLLDRHFGELVGAVAKSGALDRSLIVFTADHGETLYRDNALFHWGHGGQLAPEVLLVPLMIRAPGLAPAVYDSVTRSIDLFPTMLGLSGLTLATERAVEGNDLSQALRGQTPAPTLAAYSHTSVPHPQILQSLEGTLLHRYYPGPDGSLTWVSVRDGEFVYKLRNLDGARWGVEVFDAENDPEERNNLYDPGNSRHADMVQRLEQYKSRLVESDRSDARPLPPEEIEALRTLGYIR
jgi:arylsulfatase A-like enzyme